jgi:DIE2/ALG10 family
MMVVGLEVAGSNPVTHPNERRLPPVGHQTRAERAVEAGVVLVTCCLALWGLWRARSLGATLILDESQVLGQVRLFASGRFELLRWPGHQYPAAAMFPGFQALLALVAAVTGDASAPSLRSACFAVSVLSGLVVYGLAKELAGPRGAPLRAAQVYLLPVLFPFHCLLYTDGFSLLVTMAALWACVRRAYVAAGALMLASLLVRQTNVVFSVFLCCFSYLEVHGPRLELEPLLSHARRCWLLLAGIAALGIFVLIHGRVGLDDPSQQPLAFSAGNLAMSLVTAAVLFLPLLLADLPGLAAFVATHRRAALAVLLVAFATALTYLPSHPWNTTRWLLRNELLLSLLEGPLHRLGFGVLLAGAALWLASSPFERPASAPALALFWFLSLAPVALVEPRYQIPALVLFLLLRRAAAPAVELTLWGWLALGAVALHYGITARLFLL